MQRIGISRAWSLAQEASGGHLNIVRVFVLDTGVDFSHPDLIAKLAPGHNYLNSFSTAQDDNGHGTHVSGLIAGALNGTGMVGPGLQVEITPFKVLNYGGVGGVSSIGQAIRDAADQGADIINMSLEIALDTFALRTATEYAVSKGVLVISASGNQGRTSVSYPAAYPSVLAVGATSYFDVRTYYSNQGAALDIVAPGGLTANSILSAWTRGTDLVISPKCPAKLQEVNGGLYCENNGTSMATGLVSGAAALMMSMRPDLSAGDVQEILLETAAPISGSSNEVGNGRLDVAKALRMAIEPHLLYDETELAVTANAGNAPFIVTFALENPSLTPLHLEITPTMTTTWASLVGPRTGDVRYGEPLNVQMLYTPTAATGTLSSGLRVTTTVEGGGTAIYFINTRLTTYPAQVGNSRMYLMWAGGHPQGFQWAQPTYTARVNYAISSDSSIFLALPFTLTVNERSYTDLRLFADGFVVGSGSAFPPNLPNLCLANRTWPSFAVYGWWSDLSVDANSTLATFQPDPEHFVI
jgi:subtilisin family serine protease